MREGIAAGLAAPGALNVAEREVGHVPQISSAARGRREGDQHPGNRSQQLRVTVQKALRCLEIAGARETP